MELSNGRLLGRDEVTTEDLFDIYADVVRRVQRMETVVCSLVMLQLLDEGRIGPPTDETLPDILRHFEQFVWDVQNQFQQDERTAAEISFLNSRE